jgi:hypothetical protein
MNARDAADRGAWSEVGEERAGSGREGRAGARSHRLDATP